MILDGKKVAATIERSLRSRVARLKKKNVVPGLGVLLVGNDPASHVYVQLKGKKAEDLGCTFEKKVLPENASFARIASALQSFNDNPDIHGIIVQIPLPAHLALEDVACLIHPRKDVDCFHPLAIAHTFLNDPFILPPTPEAVLRLIRTRVKKVAGSTAVVVGDGFFGRQIALHLLNADCTVTVAHSKTKNLAALTRTADILVTAIGKPKCIRAEMVKEGACVIDVGITPRGKKIYGDCDYQALEKKAWITPVPGGVGPVTVMCLLENVVKAAEDSLTKT